MRRGGRLRAVPVSTPFHNESRRRFLTLVRPWTTQRSSERRQGLVPGLTSRQPGSGPEPSLYWLKRFEFGLPSGSNVFPPLSYWQSC
jgi:hypothetical protein